MMRVMDDGISSRRWKMSPLPGSKNVSNISIGESETPYKLMGELDRLMW